MRKYIFTRYDFTNSFKTYLFRMNNLFEKLAKTYDLLLYFKFKHKTNS